MCKRKCTWIPQRQLESNEIEFEGCWGADEFNVRVWVLGPPTTLKYRFFALELSLRDPKFSVYYNPHEGLRYIIYLKPSCYEFQ
jgi:hypothetical protein